MYKDKILKLLHKFYKKDDYVQVLTDVVQTLIYDIDVIITRLCNFLHFNRLDNEGCIWWGKLLNLSLPNTMTLKNKQSSIRARWRIGNHNSIQLIKNICSSWENGDCQATFVKDENNNGIIKLSFGGAYGVPDNLDTLLSLIDEIKPAHISYETFFKFLRIKEIHEVKTVSEMEQIQLEKFARGKA